MSEQEWVKPDYEETGFRPCEHDKLCATCEAVQPIRVARCEFCGSMAFDELYRPNPDWKPKKKRGNG